MPAYFGPISLGYAGNTGLPFQNFTRKSAMRFHDHNIAQGMPLTEWIAYELHKVTLQVTLWSPYTSDPTATILMLGMVRDQRTPLPLFVGNQMVGRGGSLFTLRSMNEKWDVVCGPVIKAKVDLEFVEYSPPLSSAQYLSITSSLAALSGALQTVSATISTVGNLANTVGGLAGGSIGGIVPTALNVTGALSGAVASVSGIGASITNFASGVSSGIANPTALATSLTGGGVTGIAGSLPPAASAVSGMATTLATSVNAAGGVFATIKTAMNAFRPLF
jgi:phage protein U